MVTEPKISVIIPIYNTAEYLPRCLDSVLRNTYRNLEVICVNDGSTDNSLEVIKRYAEEDPRVMVVNKENTGVSAARNTGLDMATGAFIAFIDSDDWVHPQYFELLYYVQKKNNADCVLCGVDITTKQNQFLEYHKTQLTITATDMPSVMADRFGRTNIWGRIYRQSLINRIRFPVGVQVAEDTVFNMNVLCSNEDVKIIGIGEKLYSYFQRGSSTIHTLPNTLKIQAIPCYQKLLNESSKAHRIYIIEQIIKTTLAFRYLSMYQSNYKEIKSECNDLLQTYIRLGNDFSFKKKLLFHMLARSPFCYRMFRIANDRSLLVWEKCEKRKKRSNCES